MTSEPTGAGGHDPVELTVFADYGCPFSRLAQPLLGSLEGDGVRIHRRAFQLHPARTPLPGPESADEFAAWDGVIAPLARALRIEMHRPRLVPRTQKAHEAVAFAAGARLEAECRHALYEAFFVEGRDIGRVDVLVEVGESIGLDPMELKIALDIDRFADVVARDEAEAARLGIAGVPAFVTAEETIEGLQPYGVLRALAFGEPTR